MIDLNDVLRVVAEWDMSTDGIAQLVWHYLVTAGNNDDPDDVLDDIVTNLNTAWANVAGDISNLLEGADIELLQYDFGNHRWDGVSSQPLTAVDGTSGTGFLPHGTAGLCKLWTEANRRQCRKYVPGLTEDEVAAGIIPPATITNLALFATDLDDVISAPLTTLTFGSFNVLPASALYETFSKSIQTAGAEAVPAYQRRRRPGTGI